MIAVQARYGVRILIGLALVAIAIAAFIVMQIRHGGPIQQRVALKDELIADVLPPPLFVVEPYLDTTLATKYPDQTAALMRDIDESFTDYKTRRAYWRDAAIPDELRPQFETTTKTADAFWNVIQQQFLPAMRAGDRARIDALHRDALTPLYHQQHDNISDLVKATSEYTANAASKDGNVIALRLGLIGALAVMLIGALAWTGRQVQRRVVVPLSAATNAIQHLAEGNFSIAIPEIERRDELGIMARAMDVFRLAGIARQRAQEEQDFVVSRLTTALEQLAQQNLECRIDEEFPAEYAKLQTDFNRAIDALARAIGTVRVGAAGVMSSISEIRMASEDLARRNEQQAASLEETAASMAQVTEGLSQTAAHATSVQRTVDAAHRTASDGGAVVQRAIAAMAAIETSSREISQIINVIDGIAFQTNLLALNAGVEAARAGESGKGFAVVANEVRALAQRSADAAHNIKSLINNSSGQVDQGVALVGETGTQLTAIVTQVAEMSSLASSIANATEQQAASLRQVHTAIRDMDLSTQQNAAMVEQSSAAAVALETEAQSLTALVATFRTRNRDERKHSSAGLRRTTSADQAVVRSSQMVRNVPAPTLPAPRPQVSGNLALAEQRDDWAEF